jgi:signal transduction histidine kinase
LPRPAAERWPALVAAVQRLAGAESVSDVIAAVHASARVIAAADGITFVLKDGDKCHYVDEDAIGPLWTGKKFPLTACISGWCMLNDKMAVIPDIYADARIPHDAYRPTFVKSLVMTPVRTTEPIAAIGCYWSVEREFDDDELQLLEALGRSVSTAMSAIAAREARRESDAALTRLQSDFAHVARLNELGEMTAAFAHELNQPLTAAQNYLMAANNLLERGASDRVADALKKAEAQFERTRATIQKIRGFTGKKETSRAAIDMTTLVEEPVALLTMDPRFRVADIAIAPMENLPPVMVDKVQIQQVLLNLVRNAIEAMEGCAGKRILIMARKDGAMVEISVADTGPGLAPEVAEKLFQPFVTTKSGGMGVGLSLCRSIVEAHGGRIDASPRDGGGTVFSFTVPAA